MKRFVLLFSLFCVVSSVFAQEQVNPALILQQCTEARGICQGAKDSCDGFEAKVNDLFSWTGIKILVGVAVISLAVWSTFFVALVIYRYLDDVRKSRSKVRYIDELEYTVRSMSSIINDLRQTVNILNRKLRLMGGGSLAENLAALDKVVEEDKPIPVKKSDSKWFIYLLITVLLFLLSFAFILKLLGVF